MVVDSDSQAPEAVEAGETPSATETVNVDDASENNADESSGASKESGKSGGGAADKEIVCDGSLQTPWSIWYSTKPKSAEENYDDCLHKIGTFSTLKEFNNYYAYLERASKLTNGSNYSVFRDTAKPKWESFPKGGCWSLQIKKGEGDLDRQWEKMIFAAIGEVFADPLVVGVAVSIRSKENSLSVWVKNNNKATRRFLIGERLKQVLSLPATSTIRFKNNTSSIKDRSTYRNGKVYVV